MPLTFLSNGRPSESIRLSGWWATTAHGLHRGLGKATCSIARANGAKYASWRRRRDQRRSNSVGRTCIRIGRRGTADCRGGVFGAQHGQIVGRLRYAPQCQSLFLVFLSDSIDVHVLRFPLLFFFLGCGWEGGDASCLMVAPLGLHYPSLNNGRGRDRKFSRKDSRPDLGRTWADQEKRRLWTSTSIRMVSLVWVVGGGRRRCWTGLSKFKLPRQIPHRSLQRCPRQSVA